MKNLRLCRRIFIYGDFADIIGVTAGLVGAHQAGNCAGNGKSYNAGRH
ncbi:hypothetical protein YPPY66_5197 [Yersinia pestis PY-66]|uniref:Uncharacterized protein n=2 Tax=Yersinia pestis TaxID=632 RepID=A0AAV3B9H6_YERPE